MALNLDGLIGNIDSTSKGGHSQSVPVTRYKYTDNVSGHSQAISTTSPVGFVPSETG